MEIRSFGYQNKIPLSSKLNSSPLNQNLKQDSFEFSSVKTSSPVSFGRGLLGGMLEIFSVKKKTPDVEQYSSEDFATPAYYKELARGIEDFFGKSIPPQNLRGIVSPEEFKQILPDLCTDNFLSTPKNIENGVYFVDLDYETNYTKGGTKNVFDVMDEIAQFADGYYEKTGNDFIFALADRDTLESARHAVRIIGENPEKYKHVKFVPALKVSYAHATPNSQLEYENSNFIVYGVNPFSESLSAFVDNTSLKRKKMIIAFIKQVNKLYPEFSYSVKEFAKQNKFMYERDFAISNLYWRAREYAETKGETAMKSIRSVPKDVIKEADDIIAQLGNIYVGTGYENFEGSDSDIIENSDLNKTIKGVFEKYSTHVDKNKQELVSSAENLFDDLISCLMKDNQRPAIAFAAPYYLCHDFDKKEDFESFEFPKTVKYMEYMRNRSNGMLTAFQSVVPMYGIDKNLSIETIKKFNQYIRDNSDFYEVGGSFVNFRKSPLTS